MIIVQLWGFEREKRRHETGANGNGILKVYFLRRKNNVNLEFDRACVRTFYDGATFHKVLKDTPHYALKFESSSGMGRIFFKIFENVAPS